jgi:hypothetical protein
MLGAGAVVDQDRARDDRGRCESVVSLNDSLHCVGRQNFESGALGRSGNRMGVLAHVERAIGALGAPVVADGLSDGENVGFGERPAQWRAAMPAGPKADQLPGIIEIRPTLEIVAFEPGRIDQHFLWRRLTCQG